MAFRVDPEGNEVAALAKAASWRGKKVLEIGCGEGRLTLRLARLGARLEALDPDPARVRAARRATAEDFRAWLAGFVAMQKLSPHAWLLGRVERAFGETRGPLRIVVSAPSTWRCCGPAASRQAR